MNTGSYALRRDRWSKVSAEGLSLVQSMLQVDPAARPTLAEILDHPWMLDDEVMEKVHTVVFADSSTSMNFRYSSSGYTDIESTNGPIPKRRRTGA